MKDVFAMFRVIARERKKREIDPTIHVLRDCIAEVGNAKTAEYTRERFSDLLSFLELGTNAFDRVADLPTPAVVKLSKLGDKAFRLLGLTK